MASTARLDELKKKFDENPRRYFAPLANEHRKSGDLDQAIALCRTHLPQQPAHISGHIVLAQALFEAGSLDESREIFHTALGLDPENLIALRYLGDIARDADDVATARGWYQRVLEVDPRNDEIVQLVRELDAPRPPVEAAASDGSDAALDPAAESVTAPAPRPAPPVPAAEDPRFAPLSLEHVDFDAPHEPTAAASPTADVAPGGEPAADASFDVHAGGSRDTPTVDLPIIDAPEMDPFDLHPSASAESLYTADAGQAHDDLFMNELADLSEPEDVGHVDPEYSVSGVWTPSASESPTAADAAPPEPADFEEGAFYLEASPEAAGESPAADATIEASTAETAGWGMPNAPADAVAGATTFDSGTGPVAELELPAIEDLAPAPPLTESAPNAELLEISSAPTAEWHVAAPSPAGSADAGVDTGFGLEVMEFVSPSSDVAPSSELLAAESFDPAMGRTPDLAPAAHVDHGGTPAAFVTETMAELYLQQGFRNEALAVYRELLNRNPADSSLRDRIDQIESGSTSSIGIAAVSEDVVESALRRQSAKPARSVRSFFSSLAGRRAPYQAPRPSATAEADVGSFAPVEEAEPNTVAPSAADFVRDMTEPTPASSSTVDDRTGPIVPASEALASFDPFADAEDLTGSSPDLTQLPDAMPNAELPAMEFDAPDPVEAAAHDDSTVRSSLENLFPDAPVEPRTEAAAQTLATAFGRQEPQGRPTRAASSELSLDKVFRGSPEGAPPTDGGFSFDQFFSGARPAGGEVASPTMSPPETGRSGGGGAGDAHDIEQFTAWLEGLKKK